MKRKLAYLEVLSELFIELLVQVLVFSNFIEKFHAFLDNVFADDFENLGLLQHFTGNVKGKIIGIDDTLDEV